MLSSYAFGVVFALISALVWGSADFSGGVAARRSNSLQVLTLAAPSGLIVLAIFSIVRGEWPLSPESFGWSMAAGASGAMGMAALYHGLARGSTALIASTAAVIGALVPVLFATVLEGMPALTQLAGFLVGIGGIWLVTKTSSGHKTRVRQDIWLAIVAGVGFGGFFVLIDQVDQGKIFSPLVVTKAMMFSLSIVMLLARGQGLPGPGSNPIALLAGVLNAGGTAFYMLARELIRLDVAAVLSSMYPVGTVVLAGLILHESITPAQWLGVVLCVLAVILIML